MPCNVIGIESCHFEFSILALYKYQLVIILKRYLVSDKVICFRTAGAEGFKKCRKGTNVAGQSTALHVSTVGVFL